ncbi:phage baseplate assembly protein V [Escherichia fergusonii]|uniref:phage baseplate assembly protein V n=1 Tax=Escherichia fergusonii TaxID=564 RepID=UPI0020CD60D1|nr:phage baseplate assembly protein V [Escherichia fergusonii]
MGQSQDQDADYTSSDTARRLCDVIRRGTVAEVQMSPPRCRVSFGGSHKSGWLQWFTLATSERVDWSAPKVGDPVTVISESGDTRNGVVLPGLLIDNRAPPSSKPNEHVVAYCDGATQTYDTESHTLTWQGVSDGTVKILGESKIEIFGRADITVTSENVVNIHGGKLINADAEVINVTATDVINAHADLVNVIATSSVSVTAANRISLTAETISAMAPEGITLAGPTHIIGTLAVDMPATFMAGIYVTGENGGTGNIETSGSVRAGAEVEDRQGSMSKIRLTYNGHQHACPDGTTGEPNSPMR